MATNDDAAMSAAVKAASDEVLQAAAAVTKACNALNPEDGEKWAQRLDRVLDAVDAYAGAPPKGAPASSAVDATAGRLFADIESALSDHDRAQGRGDTVDAAAPSSDRKHTDGRSRGVSIM